MEHVQNPTPTLTGQITNTAANTTKRKFTHPRYNLLYTLGNIFFSVNTALQRP